MSLRGRQFYIPESLSSTILLSLCDPLTPISIFYIFNSLPGSFILPPSAFFLPLLSFLLLSWYNEDLED